MSVSIHLHHARNFARRNNNWTYKFGKATKFEQGSVDITRLFNRAFSFQSYGCSLYRKNLFPFQNIKTALSAYVDIRLHTDQIEPDFMGSLESVGGINPTATVSLPHFLSIDVMVL